MVLTMQESVGTTEARGGASRSSSNIRARRVPVDAPRLAVELDVALLIRTRRGQVILLSRTHRERVAVEPVQAIKRARHFHEHRMCRSEKGKVLTPDGEIGVALTVDDTITDRADGLGHDGWLELLSQPQQHPDDSRDQSVVGAKWSNKPCEFGVAPISLGHNRSGPLKTLGDGVAGSVEQQSAPNPLTDERQD